MDDIAYSIDQWTAERIEYIDLLSILLPSLDLVSFFCSCHMTKLVRNQHATKYCNCINLP